MVSAILLRPFMAERTPLDNCYMNHPRLSAPRYLTLAMLRSVKTTSMPSLPLRPVAPLVNVVSSARPTCVPFTEKTKWLPFAETESVLD